MSKAIVNTVEFENEIGVFEDSLKNIKSIFAKEKSNLQRINDGKTWVGKTQEALYANQTSFQNNFEPIEEALEVFINFMKKALDDYNRFEATQLKNLDEGSSDLNVNSQ